MCNGENNSSNKQKKILYYLNTKEKKTVIACNFQTYICFSLPLFLIRCTGFNRIGTTLFLSEFLSGILLLFLLLHVCPRQGDLGTTIRVSREKKKKSHWKLQRMIKYVIIHLRRINVNLIDSQSIPPAYVRITHRHIHLCSYHIFFLQ